MVSSQTFFYTQFNSDSVIEALHVVEIGIVQNKRADYR